MSNNDQFEVRYTEVKALNSQLDRVEDTRDIDIDSEDVTTASEKLKLLLDQLESIENKKSLKVSVSSKSDSTRSSDRVTDSEKSDLAKQQVSELKKLNDSSKKQSDDLRAFARQQAADAKTLIKRTEANRNNRVQDRLGEVVQKSIIADIGKSVFAPIKALTDSAKQRLGLTIQNQLDYAFQSIGLTLENNAKDLAKSNKTFQDLKLGEDAFKKIGISLQKGFHSAMAEASREIEKSTQEILIKNHQTQHSLSKPQQDKVSEIAARAIGQVKPKKQQSKSQQLKTLQDDYAEIKAIRGDLVAGSDQQGRFIRAYEKEKKSLDISKKAIKASSKKANQLASKASELKSLIKEVDQQLAQVSNHYTGDELADRLNELSAQRRLLSKDLVIVETREKLFVKATEMATKRYNNTIKSLASKNKPKAYQENKDLKQLEAELKKQIRVIESEAPKAANQLAQMLGVTDTLNKSSIRLTRTVGVVASYATKKDSIIVNKELFSKLKGDLSTLSGKQIQVLTEALVESFQMQGDMAKKAMVESGLAPQKLMNNLNKMTVAEQKAVQSLLGRMDNLTDTEKKYRIDQALSGVRVRKKVLLQKKAKSLAVAEKKTSLIIDEIIQDLNEQIKEFTKRGQINDAQSLTDIAQNLQKTHKQQKQKIGDNELKLVTNPEEYSQLVEQALQPLRYAMSQARKALKTAKDAPVPTEVMKDEITSTSNKLSQASVNVAKAYSLVVQTSQKVNAALSITTKAFDQVTDSIGKVTQTLYTLLKRVESVALHAVPYGHAIQAVGSRVLPAAAAGMAANQIPGVHELISQLVHLVSNAAATNAGGAAAELTSNLPGFLQHAITEAVTNATAQATTTGTEALITVAGGAKIVDAVGGSLNLVNPSQTQLSGSSIKQPALTDGSASALVKQEPRSISTLQKYKEAIGREYEQFKNLLKKNPQSAQLVEIADQLNIKMQALKKTTAEFVEQSGADEAVKKFSSNLNKSIGQVTNQLTKKVGDLKPVDRTQLKDISAYVEIVDDSLDARLSSSFQKAVANPKVKTAMVELTANLVGSVFAKYGQEFGETAGAIIAGYVGETLTKQLITKLETGKFMSRGALAQHTQEFTGGNAMALFANAVLPVKTMGAAGMAGAALTNKIFGDRTDNSKTLLLSIIKDLGGQARSSQLPKIKSAKGVLTEAENAAYSVAENIVYLRDDLIKAVKSGKLSADQYETLAHELAHAIQFGFGALKNNRNQLKNGQDATFNRVSSGGISKREQKELNEFIKAYENRGYSKQNLDYEADAELAARRVRRAKYGDDHADYRLFSKKTPEPVKTVDANYKALTEIIHAISEVIGKTNKGFAKQLKQDIGKTDNFSDLFSRSLVTIANQGIASFLKSMVGSSVLKSFGISGASAGVALLRPLISKFLQNIVKASIGVIADFKQFSEFRKGKGRDLDFQLNKENNNYRPVPPSPPANANGSHTRPVPPSPEFVKTLVRPVPPSPTGRVVYPLPPKPVGRVVYPLPPKPVGKLVLSNGSSLVHNANISEAEQEETAHDNQQTKKAEKTRRIDKQKQYQQKIDQLEDKVANKIGAHNLGGAKQGAAAMFTALVGGFDTITKMVTILPSLVELTPILFGLGAVKRVMGTFNDYLRNATLEFEKSFNGLASSALSLSKTASITKNSGALAARAASKAEASAQMQTLDNVATVTGANLQQTRASFQGFQGATISDSSPQRITNNLKLARGLGAAAAANGLNTDQTQRLQQAIVQMQAKNSIQMEELRGQAAEAMPSIIPLMAEAIGRSTSGLMEMSKAGQLVSSQVLPKLADKLLEVYGNKALIDDYKNSYTGTMVAMENATLRLAETIGNPENGALAAVSKAFLQVPTMALNALAGMGSLVNNAILAALASVGFSVAIAFDQVLKLDKVANFTTKVTDLLRTGFAGAARAFSPFIMGIVTDFVDDFFGAETGALDNIAGMMKGLQHISSSMFQGMINVSPWANQQKAIEETRNKSLRLLEVQQKLTDLSTNQDSKGQGVARIDGDVKNKNIGVSDKLVALGYQAFGSSVSAQDIANQEGFNSALKKSIEFFTLYVSLQQGGYLLSALLFPKIVDLSKSFLSMGHTLGSTVKRDFKGFWNMTGNVAEALNTFSVAIGQQSKGQATLAQKTFHSKLALQQLAGQTTLTSKAMSKLLSPVGIATLSTLVLTVGALALSYARWETESSKAFDRNKQETDQLIERLKTTQETLKALFRDPYVLKIVGKELTKEETEELINEQKNKIAKKRLAGRFVDEATGREQLGAGFDYFGRTDQWQTNRAKADAMRKREGLFLIPSITDLIAGLPKTIDTVKPVTNKKVKDLQLKDASDQLLLGTALLSQSKVNNLSGIEKTLQQQKASQAKAIVELTRKTGAINLSQSDSNTTKEASDVTDKARTLRDTLANSAFINLDKRKAKEQEYATAVKNSLAAQKALGESVRERDNLELQKKAGKKITIEQLNSADLKVENARKDAIAPTMLTEEIRNDLNKEVDDLAASIEKLTALISDVDVYDKASFTQTLLEQSGISELLEKNGVKDIKDTGNLLSTVKAKAAPLTKITRDETSLLPESRLKAIRDRVAIEQAKADRELDLANNKRQQVSSRVLPGLSGVSGTKATEENSLASLNKLKADRKRLNEQLVAMSEVFDSSGQLADDGQSKQIREDLKAKEVEIAKATEELQTAEFNRKRSELERLRALQDLQKQVIDFERSKYDLAKSFSREDVDRERKRYDDAKSWDATVRSLRDKAIDAQVTQFRAEEDMRIKTIEAVKSLSSSSYDTLKSSLPGSELTNQFIDNLAAIQEAQAASSENQADILADRVDIEKSLRDLAIDAADTELQRVRSLQDLAKEEDDFKLNRQRQLEDLGYQQDALNRQIQDQGTNFEELNKYTIKAGNALIDSINQLALNIAQVSIDESSVSNFNSLNVAETAAKLGESFKGAGARCAEFVSEVLKSSGASSAYSKSVEELNRQLTKQGATQITDIKNVKAGDVIMYRDTYEGLRGGKGDGELTHTGVAVGSGQQWDNSSKNQKAMNRPIDLEHFAFALRLPSSQQTKSNNGFSNDNVAKFAKLIVDAETTPGKDPYKTHFGGEVLPNMLTSTHPGTRGKASSASGAFQAMDYTWKNVMGNATLSIENQNKFFEKQLKARGVFDTISQGKALSNKQKDSLAMEWASLPSPAKGGKSWYGGDGLNAVTAKGKNIWSLYDEQIRGVKTNRAIDQLSGKAISQLPTLLPTNPGNVTKQAPLQSTQQSDYDAIVAEREATKKKRDLVRQLDREIETSKKNAAVQVNLRQAVENLIKSQQEYADKQTEQSKEIASLTGLITSGSNYQQPVGQEYFDKARLNETTLERNKTSLERNQLATAQSIGVQANSSFIAANINKAQQLKGDELNQEEIDTIRKEAATKKEALDKQALEIIKTTDKVEAVKKLNELLNNAYGEVGAITEEQLLAIKLNLEQLAIQQLDIENSKKLTPLYQQAGERQQKDAQKAYREEQDDKDLVREKDPINRFRLQSKQAEREARKGIEQRIEDARASGMSDEEIEAEKLDAATDALKDYNAAMVEANPLTETFTSGLKGLLEGSKSVGDVFSEMGRKILDMMLETVMSGIAQQFTGMLSGLFGIKTPSFGGGTTPNHALGYNNYAAGCTTPNYSGGLYGIGSAINKERNESKGMTPQLAVINQSESVLSSLNGDSQLYKQLKRTGGWDNLKNGSMPNMALGSFKSDSSGGSGNTYNRNGGTYNTTVVQRNSYNLSAKDSKNVSEAQINRIQDRAKQKMNRI